MIFDIERLRKIEASIVSIGSHRGIIQSILDFDYLAGKHSPSVSAIIAAGRQTERYFYGTEEVLIPVYASATALPKTVRRDTNLCINVSSGRRVKKSTLELMAILPSLLGVVVFAERLPERHALELIAAAKDQKIWIAGGASVGCILPNVVKLGAIGGVDARQLEVSNLFASGQVAVVSSSGGMVNEIIHLVAESGYGLSFAIAVGGERYTMLTPEDALLAAEKDPMTKAIAYFGELGGDDEYRIVELIKAKALTKPILAYIAGGVADLFETPPQFGHAKAMAQTTEESAHAKAVALRAVGVQVAESFATFTRSLHDLKGMQKVASLEVGAGRLTGRSPKLLASSLSYDVDGDVHILGTDLLDFATNNSFASIVGSMLLGQKIKSRELEECIDFVLRLLVDHGPYVSGSVNTIVSARAGRDLVSSLSSGLLTIGPRFGGAINEAAGIWIQGVSSNAAPQELVEAYAARKQYISGIGHKKYRVDFPDPRVQRLMEFKTKLSNTQFTDYAQAIERITAQKKGNLILNIDGAIAALLLDVLHDKEGYDLESLRRLVDQEFFNGLFVLSRSVGLMAHYFDQRRLDEGLLRLSEQHVLAIPPPTN
jgi:ATP citrate (pro-S)-lyase